MRGTEPRGRAGPVGCTLLLKAGWLGWGRQHHAVRPLAGTPCVARRVLRPASRHLPAAPPPLLGHPLRQVASLLESIPRMFASTQVVETCGGAALRSAVEALKGGEGGRLHAFLCSLPRRGAMHLRLRDVGRAPTDRDTLDSLLPESKEYAALAQDAANHQVSIDLFLLAQARARGWGCCGVGGRPGGRLCGRAASRGGAAGAARGRHSTWLQHCLQPMGRFSQPCTLSSPPPPPRAVVRGRGHAGRAVRAHLRVAAPLVPLGPRARHRRVLQRPALVLHAPPGAPAS